MSPGLEESGKTTRYMYDRESFKLQMQVFSFPMQGFPPSMQILANFSPNPGVEVGSSRRIRKGQYFIYSCPLRSA